MRKRRYISHYYYFIVPMATSLTIFSTLNLLNSILIPIRFLALLTYEIITNMDINVKLHQNLASIVERCFSVIAWLTVLP